MTNNREIRRFEILSILDDIKINDKISSEITCIDVHNDDIYLGTADSFILFYPSIFKKTQQDENDKLIRPVFKYLGLKKSISQLKVLSILGHLICICDNTLSLCNLNNLEANNSFKQVRNIFNCCLNQNPISMDPFNVELCLAKRKSLTIALVQSDKMTTIKEINVPEQPLVMAMDGQYVCVATQFNYYMINWNENSVQFLCGIGEDPYSSPICKYISRNEFLINGPGYLGVFVKTSGISERPPISWGPNIIQIAYSYPYILCLKPHSVSIISIIDSKIKDEFLVENAVYIDNFDGKIVMVTKERVLSMHRISWEEQIDSLLMNEKCQEAIEMFHDLNESGMLMQNSIDYVQSIHVRAGLIELKKKNLELAKKFLSEIHFEIERLFNLNLNLTEILKVQHEEANPDVKFLIDKVKTELEQDVIDKFLLEYIQEYENQSETPIDVKLAKTAKLLIYLTNVPVHFESIKAFLKTENDYSFTLIEIHLQQRKLYYLLAMFYSARNDTDKAIDLLENLEKNVVQDEHYPGISELCRLLNNCHDAQLILNHIEFILERNPIEGARILIANTILEQNKFTMLNPDFVIAMLHKYREALVIYLEHLIFETRIQTSQIHTTLIIIYIEILSLQKENEEQGSKLYGETKTKLRRLLEESEYYDKRSVLKCLINHRLDYEAALLYGKLGEHIKAFKIYLEEYSDYDQALKHCLQYGMKDDHYDPQVYQTLLTIYLDLFRKNGPEVMKPLLEYLNHSKCRFDLETTLNELPEDWPLILIKRHLSNHLNRIFDSKFQTSFGRCLALSLLERTKQEKLRLNNQPIRIDSDSLCQLCNAKLLDSKFVWIPAKKMIVHDFCYYGTNFGDDGDKSNWR